MTFHVPRSDAQILADRILGVRSRPLVLISSLKDKDAFAFDPEFIREELLGEAEVLTIITGSATFELAKLLPPKSSVYNGAARSYPPTYGQDPSPYRSYLRFPNQHDVHDLIEDALSQGTACQTPAPVQRRQWVTATVERVSGASTGNVARLADGRRVLINADRLPGWISLASCLTEGATVYGSLLESDLSPEAAEPDMSRFVEDCVTLARVVKVTDLRATMVLHPSAESIVLRRRDVITGADDEDNTTTVSEVLHPGQTVRVRVQYPNGQLALSMVNLPEGDIVQPLPLLRGGQPWLQEGVDEEIPEPTEENTESPQSAEVPALAAQAPVAQPVPLHTTALPTATGPHDELWDLQQEMVALRGAFERFSREMRAGTDLETLDNLRDELRVVKGDLHRQVELNAEYKRMIASHNQQLREARSSRPNEQSGGPTTSRDQWPDDESWIRHEIPCAWAARTTASDKREYPIRLYSVGRNFAASIKSLDDRTFDKAMRATVDVVTERAGSIPARKLHALRQGAGGDDASVRDSDGSACWRVYIEENTPQARRLHFWRLPNGGIELSRIVQHDDFMP